MSRPSPPHLSRCVPGVSTAGPAGGADPGAPVCRVADGCQLPVSPPAAAAGCHGRAAPQPHAPPSPALVRALASQRATMRGYGLRCARLPCRGRLPTPSSRHPRRQRQPDVTVAPPHSRTRCPHRRWCAPWITPADHAADAGSGAPVCHAVAGHRLPRPATPASAAAAAECHGLLPPTGTGACPGPQRRTMARARPRCTTGASPSRRPPCRHQQPMPQPSASQP